MLPTRRRRKQPPREWDDDENEDKADGGFAKRPAGEEVSEGYRPPLKRQTAEEG